MNLLAVMKDITGRYLTRALFVELTDREMAEKYPPLCTLKEAHDLYMEVSDPTEYKFAFELLFNKDTNFWDHWQRLVNTPLFLEYLVKWREELDIKLKSEAISAIKVLAKTDNLPAARWLAEKGYADKRKAGRPSKQDIDNEKKLQVSMQQEVEDDAARISVKH